MAVAGGKISMAEELLSMVSCFGYKEIVPFINERDAITLDKFKTTQLAEYFTIDTSRAFVNGRANSNHIYELFGDLAGYTVMQVRLLLLKHMAKDPGFHIRWGTVCLEMRNITFQRWLNRVADEKMYCDELGLLSLSHMCRRHTLVVTVNKMWSTIEHSTPLNLLELLNECSIKLVYLGQLHFGELKPRTARPTRLISSQLTGAVVKNVDHPERESPIQPSTRTGITETIPSTGSSATTVSAHVPLTLSVETNKVGANDDVPYVEAQLTMTMNVETKKDRDNVEQHESVQSASHVETNKDISVNPQFNVETPSITRTEATSTMCIQMSKVTKTAKLVLEPLRDLDIDIWCRKTKDYHMFVPPMEHPPDTVESGYSLRHRKPKAQENRSVSVSLRKTNKVNYAPMLDSGSDESNEPKKNTVNKIRPKLDRPSDAVLTAHEQIQNKKHRNFETKPVPILPV